MEVELDHQMDFVNLLTGSLLVQLPAHFMVWLSTPEAQFLNGKFVWANWDVEELKAQAKDIESTDKMSVTFQGWPFANMG